MGGGWVKEMSVFFPGFLAFFKIMAFSMGSRNSELAITSFSFFLPLSGFDLIAEALVLPFLELTFVAEGFLVLLFLVFAALELELDVLETLEEATAFFLLF